MNSGTVAIYVDGKNFYEGLRRSGLSTRIDFGSLADQIVEEVGGDNLSGLHYFTGVDRVGEENPDDEDRRSGLETFLSFLETQAGCFVYRFPRRRRKVVCRSCGTEHSYSEEKQVDTSLVAAMIRQGAIDAFDTAILCSGDTDHAPALEALRELGKPVWVATFGSYGLSRRLRSAAFGHIDLEPLMQARSVAGGEDDGPDDLGQGSARESVDVVAAVHEAQEYFGAGRYVGLSMFSRDWRSSRLPRDPSERQRSIQDAIDAGELEVYDAADGRKAVRVAQGGNSANAMERAGAEIDDNIGNRIDPAEQERINASYDEDDEDDDADPEDNTAQNELGEEL